MIYDNSMEIYWKNEADNTMILYWAGSYTAPTSNIKEYTWDSKNDKNLTNSSILASSEDIKTFTYKNGILSYSVSALGITRTFNLKLDKNVNFKSRNETNTFVDPDKKEDLLPLELVESGYNYTNELVYFAFIVKNPNKEKAIKKVKIRVTARDADGSVLGTEDIGGFSSSYILAESNRAYTSSLSIDKKPAKLDFEIIKPQDDDWTDKNNIKYDNNKILNVSNVTKRKDKIVGEISNPYDFNIDTAELVILYRNENNELVGGQYTYVKNILSNSKTPFDILIYSKYSKYKFDIFVYPR